jgi:hypothetical protein
MSPTPGVPEFESEVPNEPDELLSSEAAELTNEESCLTEIDKSITDILAATETVQELAPAVPLAGKRGRPARQTIPPITWSIRGVTRDTRALLEQAARQVGKTLGQYLNEDIRFCVEQQLHLVPPPSTMVTLQKQVHYLRQLVENLTVLVRASHAGSPLPGRPADQGPTPA